MINEGLHGIIFRIIKVMDVVGGTVLTLMMLITVIDVILRFFENRLPHLRACFSGGSVVIGCAIPRTSWEGGHVNG
jgi:hypothetical protein